MVKGSFTVEAVFIVPMIVCLIVLVIIESMYMHDMAVETSKIYVMVEDDKSQEEMKNAANDGLFLLKTSSLNVSSSLTGKKVVWKYQFDIGFFNQIKEGKLKLLHGTINAPQRLRMSTAVKEVIDHD